MRPLSEWKTTQVVRYSWQVVREDRVFLLFPVFSALSMLVTISLTLGVLYGSGFFSRFDVDIAGITMQKLTESSVRGATIPEIALIVSAYLLTVFAAIYFNAAMFAAATQRLNGQKPRFWAAIRRVNACLPELIGWACFSSTLGFVINYLVSTHDPISKIPGIVMSWVWTFTTYFVVPFLVLEGLSPADAVKRSTGLFRATWGKQIKGNVSFLLVYIALALPLVAACMLGSAVHALAGGVLALLYLPFFLAGLAMVLAMDGVFNAALFRFATTSQVSPDYPAHLITGAYRGKRDPDPLPALPNRPGQADWSSAAWPVDAPYGSWPERPRTPGSSRFDGSGFGSV